MRFARSLGQPQAAVKGLPGRAPCGKGATKRERVHSPVRSECAVSSVGEHHIDTVGVASSILAPRTIEKRLKSLVKSGFFFIFRGTLQTCSLPLSGSGHKGTISAFK